jgi:hypothetical protein
MKLLAPRFAFLAISLIAAIAVLSTRAESPRPDDPVESKWFRKLPSGVTVELLGMTDRDAKAALWWTPDGKPLAAPVTNVGLTRGGAGTQTRNIVVRVEGPSNYDLDVLWMSDRTLSSESGDSQDDMSSRGLDMATMEFPANAASWNIQMEVAAGQWVTDATLTIGGLVKSRIEGRSVIFTVPRIIERGIAIVVVEDFPGRRDVRVVAFDRDGKQLSTSASGRGWESKAFRVHDASLMGIKPDQVDHYELQSRPIETVEFRDVPLAVPKR